MDYIAQTPSFFQSVLSYAYRCVDTIRAGIRLPSKVTVRWLFGRRDRLYPHCGARWRGVTYRRCRSHSLLGRRWVAMRYCRSWTRPQRRYQHHPTTYRMVRSVAVVLIKLSCAKNWIKLIFINSSGYPLWTKTNKNWQTYDKISFIMWQKYLLIDLHFKHF